MKFELSIIVPIYNSEKYLEKTLISLINQTIFEKIEIILVNDGSTDNSEKICKNYSKKFSNIITINKENGGVSSARNKGLENVKTKYVTFLDSDDIVSSDFYEKELNEITKENCDILIVDFEKVHEDGFRKKYRKNFVKKFKNCEEALIDFFHGEIGGQVVDKVFCSEIIKKIIFSSEYQIGEDMLFMYNALKNGKKIVINTNICGYQYIVRDSSAMTGKFSEKYFDPIKISKFMYLDCMNNDKLKNYAYAHFIHESCKVIEYVYRHNAQYDCELVLNEIKNDIKKYKIKYAYKYLIKKQFYGFMLIKLSPKLYLFFHKIMHIG